MSGYYEVYRGVVLDTADPTDQRRVLVQVPEILAEQSEWARPEQSSAALPAVGDVVSVRFESGDEAYPLWSLDAVPTDTAEVTPAAAGYPGTYRGLALDTNDPGGYARVLVTVPEVLGEQSLWAMPEHEGATPPAIGDELWIRFEQGNVDYPMWSA